VIRKINQLFGFEQAVTLATFFVCAALYLPVCYWLEAIARDNFHQFQHRRAMDAAAMANQLLDCNAFEKIVTIGMIDLPKHFLPYNSKVQISMDYYSKIGRRYTAPYVEEGFTRRQASQILDTYGDTECTAWAIMMDYKGFGPWHMTKYSEYLTGDLDYDLVHSRNQKIWVNWIDRIAASKGHPVEYVRQPMGEKQFFVAAEMKILDKPWGYFIIGYTPEQIERYIPNFKTPAMLCVFTTAFVVKFFIFFMRRKKDHD